MHESGVTRRGVSLRVIATLVIVGLWLGACAIIEPPPGGPEDRQAPDVASTIPRPDSAGVDPASDIVIQFNEGMRRTAIERSITMRPPARIRKTRWSKSGLTLSFDEPLHPDTTYIFELAGGFQDEHGVRNNKGYRFAFATSAAIDSGKIAGRVLFRREQTDKAVVRLFTLPKDSAFAPQASRPDRQTESQADGSYSLAYLPTNGTDMVVWAFQDANGNGNFEPENEVGGEPDTVHLTTTVSTLENVSFAIVDPGEPVVVTGTIDNQTAIDSMFITVTAHELSDTMPPPTAFSLASGRGDISMKILQGEWVLYAFLDIQADSLCGTYRCVSDTTQMCPEPCSIYPDTIRVEPGDEVQLGEWVLLPAGEIGRRTPAGSSGAGAAADSSAAGQSPNGGDGTAAADTTEAEGE
jgi:hypothetical protein